MNQVADVYGPREDNRQKTSLLNKVTQNHTKSMGQLSIAVQLWPGLLDCLGCMDEAKLEVAKVLKEALQHPTIINDPQSPGNFGKRSLDVIPVHTLVIICNH